MKQQLLEMRMVNAQSALVHALTWLDKGDTKHARDYLVRGIELLADNDQFQFREEEQ